MLALDRIVLADEVVGRLRHLILGRELSEGERLNEVHLAERLGVSRTPLREALGRLVAEGLARHVPHRGFFVPRLSRDEALDLYPMRAILDPEALALAGIPSARRLAELRRLNRAIAASAGAPIDTLDLDERWHRLLLEGCPNRVLLELIESFTVRTRRYEVAYFEANRHVQVATGEHDRILDLLEHERLEPACRALRRNMESAVDPILRWLETREQSQKSQKSQTTQKSQTSRRGDCDRAPRRRHPGDAR